MSKRKEQKADETIIDIVDTKDNIQDIFNKNAKLIIGIIAAIILLAAIYFIYKYLVIAPKEKAAIEQIYKAEEQFAKDSFALALENPGAGYEGFLDIIDNYSGTKTANTAKYYAGISYLNLGRFQDAIDYLSDVSAKGDVLPIMKFGAMGDAYSELGDMDKAASMYTKAINSNNNEFLTPYYLQKLGLLRLSQGNSAESAKFFNRIKKDFPDSQIASEVAKFIQ